MRIGRAGFVALAVWCVAVLPGLAAGKQNAEPIVMHDCLLLAPVGQGGRNPIHRDALEAQIVGGQWHTPKAGDTVALPDGKTQTWTQATPKPDGSLESPALQGGYAFWQVPSESERVMILEASSHSTVYVNGVPRAGDPYGYGYVRLPVHLRKGANEFLFSCGRGRVQARLVTPTAPVMLDTRDSTLPDIRLGENQPVWGAVVVINATDKPLTRLMMRARSAERGDLETVLRSVPPMSVRKVGFRFRAAADKPQSVPVSLLLLDKNSGHATPADQTEIKVEVRKPEQSYKRTFLSEMDGSVQYYAVQPAQPLLGDKTPPALFLALHGASVEAIGHVNACSPKSWGHIVSPTNRRPYGFDWEEWGRLDALEVLNLAQSTLHTDPRRTYLMGHSMGGHGTWYLGATSPDRFAAIGPSAGWISFSSYVGGNPSSPQTDVEKMLLRAASPSDTLAMQDNYRALGIYILHGGADDNVPVTEARNMSQRLAAFHHDYTYFEQPGAGHWWDAHDEAGVDCVDWQPMFDLFARHELPDDRSLREVDFTTVSPGISAWCHWACIAQQVHALEPSKIELHYDPGLKRFAGTTQNVARLALKLDAVPPGEPLQIEIDGGKLENVRPAKGSAVLWLERQGAAWALSMPPADAAKSPVRYGPFKQAFGHRMMLVYGTKGTPEENAWAQAKAQYDAESLWYRGNGSVDVLSDTDFLLAQRRPRTPGADERNVLLYGNQETNAAWKSLLPNVPVQLTAGRVTMGGKTTSGDNLACLFAYPRANCKTALVGVIGGTGLAGMRLTERIPYFLSGVHLPDVTVLSTDTLTKGAAGVRAAGFFGNDWKVEFGEFAWQE